MNFDLNRDKLLQHPDQAMPTSYNEIDAISNGRTPPSDTLNVYFVGMESSKADVRGLSFLNTQHIWFFPAGFTFNGVNMSVAHEIGHAIGNPHTSEDINATDYYRDLMFYGYLNETVNQCRVRKPQWDKARLLP